jgi:hypothetical protein
LHVSKMWCLWDAIGVIGWIPSPRQGLFESCIGTGIGTTVYEAATVGAG